MVKGERQKEDLKKHLVEDESDGTRVSVLINGTVESSVLLFTCGFQRDSAAGTKRSLRSNSDLR